MKLAVIGLLSIAALAFILAVMVLGSWLVTDLVRMFQ